jgi:hypothetical protein
MRCCRSPAANERGSAKGRCRSGGLGGGRRVRVANLNLKLGSGTELVVWGSASLEDRWAMSMARRSMSSALTRRGGCCSPRYSEPAP